MPIVRATGAAVCVRYAGRHLRVSSEWSEVSADALDCLNRKAAGAFEEQSAAPPRESIEERTPEEVFEPPKRKKKATEEDSPKGGALSAEE